MRSTPQVQRISAISVEAPMGGLNTVASGIGVPASDALVMWNLTPAEYGLRSRLGYREWVTGLDGEVRSLPCFMGSNPDGSDSAIFACTPNGIYDVTASTDDPDPKVVTFSTQDSTSGFGEHCAFTDSSGSHWLLYCDESNGYYTHSEATSTWVKVTQDNVSPGAGEIGGVDPAKLVQVIVHHGRCWFVEKNTQRAWYTGLYSLYGAVTAFNFGAHFPHGGDLRCLAAWTRDGGSGPEDRLIAISGSGDVVIYEGTDPSSADTWRIVGSYYVGAVPVGRRLATNLGGDVAIMSSTGIITASQIVGGNALVGQSQYSTIKIANLFNQLQLDSRDQWGWSMRVHPQDSTLIVLSPTPAESDSIQLVMSLNTRGWSRYRGLPIGHAAEPWGNTLYFGTFDGRVCINDGYVDGILLSSPSAYTPIDCVLVSAYSTLGTSAYKRVQFIRAKMVGQGGSIQATAEARYSLSFAEPYPPPMLPPTSGGSAFWDVSAWDQATWGGSYAPTFQTFGAFGIGVEVAVAFHMRVSSRASLVGFDVGYDVGGVL